MISVRCHMTSSDYIYQQHVWQHFTGEADSNTSVMSSFRQDLISWYAICPTCLCHDVDLSCYFQGSHSKLCTCRTFNASWLEKRNCNRSIVLVITSQKHDWKWKMQILKKDPYHLGYMTVTGKGLHSVLQYSIVNTEYKHGAGHKPVSWCGPASIFSLPQSCFRPGTAIIRHTAAHVKTAPRERALSFTVMNQFRGTRWPGARGVVVVCGLRPRPGVAADVACLAGGRRRVSSLCERSPRRQTPNLQWGDERVLQIVWFAWGVSITKGCDWVTCVTDAT